MPTNLNAHADAALTTVITSVQFNQLPDGSNGNVDKSIYLGTPLPNSVFKAQSDPGVDPIMLSVVDATPASGVEASNFKLSLTLAGLDSAVAGDPLNLGTVINGGAASAIEVFIRCDSPVLAAQSMDVTFVTTVVEEDL